MDDLESRALSTRKHAVFLYPDVASSVVPEFEAGRVPRERLAGLMQLRERGWTVRISDSRWTTWTAGLRRRLRRFAYLPHLRTMWDWRDASIIVIRDDFSMLLTIAAKACGKKVVYLDLTTSPPRRWWRRFGKRSAIRLADRVVGFSRTQIELWADDLNLPRERFAAVPWGMDTEFYRLEERNLSSVPYVVAVGRDPGRDYDLLAEAIEDTELELKLVTLPYLLSDRIRSNPRIEVMQRLSYPDLFRVYAGAVASIVPLRSSVTHPSGIRAVMEGMLLGIPTIATRTSVLDEYFQEGDLLMVPAGDANALAGAMRKVADDAGIRERLAEVGRQRILEDYPVERFVDRLEEELLEVLRSS